MHAPSDKPHNLQSLTLRVDFGGLRVGRLGVSGGGCPLDSLPWVPRLEGGSVYSVPGLS